MDAKFEIQIPRAQISLINTFVALLSDPKTPESVCFQRFLSLIEIAAKKIDAGENIDEEIGELERLSIATEQESAPHRL